MNVTKFPENKDKLEEQNVIYYYQIWNKINNFIIILEQIYSLQWKNSYKKKITLTRNAH